MNTFYEQFQGFSVDTRQNIIVSPGGITDWEVQKWQDIPYYLNQAAETLQQRYPGKTGTTVQLLIPENLERFDPTFNFSEFLTVKNVYGIPNLYGKLDTQLQYKNEHEYQRMNFITNPPPIQSNYEGKKIYVFCKAGDLQFSYLCQDENEVFHYIKIIIETIKANIKAPILRVKKYQIGINIPAISFDHLLSSNLVYINDPFLIPVHTRAMLKNEPVTGDTSILYLEYYHHADLA